MGVFLESEGVRSIIYSMGRSIDPYGWHVENKTKKGSLHNLVKANRLRGRGGIECDRGRATPDPLRLFGRGWSFTFQMTQDTTSHNGETSGKNSSTTAADKLATKPKNRHERCALIPSTCLFPSKRASMHM